MQLFHLRQIRRDTCKYRNLQYSHMLLHLGTSLYFAHIRLDLNIVNTIIQNLFHKRKRNCLVLKTFKGAVLGSSEYCTKDL